MGFEYCFILVHDTDPKSAVFVIHFLDIDDRFFNVLEGDVVNRIAHRVCQVAFQDVKLSENFLEQIISRKAKLKIAYLSLDSKGNFYHASTPDFRAEIYCDDSTGKWHSGGEAPPAGISVDQALNNWQYESTFLFSKKMD